MSQLKVGIHTLYMYIYFILYSSCFGLQNSQLLPYFRFILRDHVSHFMVHNLFFTVHTFHFILKSQTSYYTIHTPLHSSQIKLCSLIISLSISLVTSYFIDFTFQGANLTFHISYFTVILHYSHYISHTSYFTFRI